MLLPNSEFKRRKTAAVALFVVSESVAEGQPASRMLVRSRLIVYLHIGCQCFCTKLF